MEQVILTDVTGRDGFQMEKQWIETTDKIDILNGVLASGIKHIEATSFVSPKAIPQMRDAADVIRGLNREGVHLVALVPNVKGAERALEADVDELNVVMSISESHNKKNVNKTVEQSIEGILEISRLATPERTNVSLATTFGCPFEGLYRVDKVLAALERLHGAGLDRFTLADTTGMASPAQITAFVERVKQEFPASKFALHLHNTRGMGLANLYAGYQAGIRHFDAALGGIGGCPFAPGASGNVCLEDIVHMLKIMEVPVDADIESLIVVSQKLERVLGYKLPGQVMKAGLSTETVAV